MIVAGNALRFSQNLTKYFRSRLVCVTSVGVSGKKKVPQSKSTKVCHRNKQFFWKSDQNLLYGQFLDETQNELQGL